MKKNYPHRLHLWMRRHASVICLEVFHFSTWMTGTKTKWCPLTKTRRVKMLLSCTVVLILRLYPKQCDITENNTTCVNFKIQCWPKDKRRFHLSECFCCSGKYQESGRPPVQICQLENRGKGLVATRLIEKGSCIFTEKAAIATQLPSSTFIDSCWPPIQACQHCFRSLEHFSKVTMPGFMACFTPKFR